MESFTRKHGVRVAGVLGTLMIAVLGLSFAVSNGAEQSSETPALSLRIKGPEQATVGGKVTFEIVVTNEGKTTAQDLLITDQYDAGLEHAIGANPIEHDLNVLTPGKSQRLPLTFRVTQAGSLSHTAEITSGGQVVASAKATVRAVAAAGETAKSAVTDSVKQEPPVKERAEPAKGKPEAKPSSDSAFPDIPYRKPEEADEREKPPVLGPPLVENAESLVRLHPEQPVWIDRKQKQVVVMGGVCLRQGPLELFACQRQTKEHESILSIPTRSTFVHAALIAVGAEPGSPVQYQPKYVAAHGTEIDISVIWKDEKGQRKTAKAEEWVRDVKTKKAMSYPWVFAGSHLVTNPATGKVVYQADHEGDLICVSNFPDAVLDLPVKSSAENAELMFEAFTERIPPVGTPVTLLLTPKKAAKPAETPASKVQAPATPETPAKTEPNPTQTPKATPEPKPATTEAKPAAKS